LGRTSFLGFSSYWPFVADAPADPVDRSLSQDNRNISRVYNRLPKMVVSDTLHVPDDNPWHSTTTVVPRASVAGELDRLRTGGDGDVLVFGSHLLWNALLAARLVDELHIMVSPNALGAGIPLITGPVRLALLGTRTFDGSDNVLLRYAAR
jgi:dihydrofolate reductase